MLQLSDKWGPRLVSQPETGMGYHVATILLRSGRRYEQALIESGVVTRIRGLTEIPFKDEDIADIVVTHDKWDFAREK
jgi:hypothetical protein